MVYVKGQEACVKGCDVSYGLGMGYENMPYGLL